MDKNIFTVQLELETTKPKLLETRSCRLHCLVSTELINDPTAGRELSTRP